MVTNSIEEDDARPRCNSLTNGLLTPEEIDMESANSIGILFAPEASTEVDYEAATGNEENGGGGNGGDNPPIGGQRTEAGPEDGLGGAGMLEFSWAMLIGGAVLGMSI